MSSDGHGSKPRFDEKGNMVEKTYCTPVLGYPFYSRDDNFHNDYFNRDVPPMRSFYRWHVMDPVLFEENLRVELQQIGVGPLGLFERQDDVSSVSYWYQSEPHAPFPALPEETFAVAKREDISLLDAYLRVLFREQRRTAQALRDQQEAAARSAGSLHGETDDPDTAGEAFIRALNRAL